MTESEWLAATEPEALARHHPFRPRPSARKWRLLAASFCWRMTYWFLHPQQFVLLDLIEEFADGTISAEQLEQGRPLDLTSDRLIVAADTDIPLEIVVAHPLADEELDRLGSQTELKAAGAAAEALRTASEVRWTSPFPSGCPRELLAVASSVRRSASVAAEGSRDAHAIEGQALADLFRDILGNPFRRPRFNPAWRTSSVVRIATMIHADRSFADLPVLADALQDAGCEDEQILGHCRAPVPHARGCWVVDALLGKK